MLKQLFYQLPDKRYKVMSKVKYSKSIQQSISSLLGFSVCYHVSSSLYWFTECWV